MGICGDHELPRLHRQQIIFPHDARHALVIGQHASSPQFRRNPTVTVAAPMFQHDLLDGRSQFHVFFDRGFVLQETVKSRPAYLRQLTHSLDTRAALHRHHFLDLVVDAVSPELPLRWRRASTFCKAPLKKSTSTVFSASSRFSWCTSLRSTNS